jgi:hypothetical protein
MVLGTAERGQEPARFRSASYEATGTGSAGLSPVPAHCVPFLLCVTTVPSRRSRMVRPRAGQRPLPSLPGSRGSLFRSAAHTARRAPLAATAAAALGATEHSCPQGPHMRRAQPVLARLARSAT